MVKCIARCALIRRLRDRGAVASAVWRYVSPSRATAANSHLSSRGLFVIQVYSNIVINRLRFVSFVQLTI